MKKFIIITLSAIIGLSISAMAYDSTDVTVTAEKKPSKIKKARAEVKEVIFHVHLHCASCVQKVVENIAFEKGVKDLKVSQTNHTVMVKYDSTKTNVKTLEEAIEALGYEADLQCSPTANHKH